MVGLHGLIVCEFVGGFDQPAVRADAMCETSTPWKTGFPAGVAPHYLGLSHFLPFEHMGSPSGEVFGEKFDFEIVDRSDVRHDVVEEFHRDIYQRSNHRRYCWHSFSLKLYEGVLYNVWDADSVGFGGRPCGQASHK